MSDKGETGATGETGAEGAAGAVGAAGAEGAVGRQGLQGEAGPASMLDPVSAKAIKDGLRFLVIATAVLYLMLFGVVAYVWVDSRGNTADNDARIADIQKARASSCRQTYEGIREVFRPFFPPQPRTAEQQADLDTFNNKVDSLKANCDKQTDTEEEP